MKKSACLSGALFLTLSIIEVTALAIGIADLHAYIKPFLMPSLMATAVLALLPAECGRKDILNLAIALSLHTIGDILLLFPGMNFLMAGLGAFLTGHIFYLLIFWKLLGDIKPSAVLWAVVLPALIIPALITIPFELSGPMRIAVTIYASALLCITACGIGGIIRKTPYSALIVAGGLFFIISDFMIGLEAFMDIDFPFRHPSIMLTYILAEALLVSGVALPYIKRNISGNE